MVERLDSAVMASWVVCGEAVSSVRVLTRWAMAPEAPIQGLLTGEAVRVKTAAIAYSLSCSVGDWRKEIRGWSAPASTILILFLKKNKIRTL